MAPSTDPLVARALPPGLLFEPPRRRPRARRWTIAAAAVGLLASLLALVAPFRSGAADAAAPVVGTDASDCAPNGFDRPTGPIPPGYLYSPTVYNGTVQDPQPDDTFAADGPGHPAFTGNLRTRMANGREEFLVCAHIGTNMPDNALTPFPTTHHPTTIVPRVVVISASGAASTYDITTPGLTNVAVAHYKGSLDGHEGIVQMWIPFTPDLAAPGFTVRTEIRGTAATPNGGASLLMGADEAFVHLGLAPVPRNVEVNQAVGLSLDDSFIAERPTDPGPDDLQSIISPFIASALDSQIKIDSPQQISSDWDWSGSDLTGGSASGTLDSLSFLGGLDKLDVVDDSPTQSHLLFRVKGTAYPTLTLDPSSAGAYTIISGTCHVTASVSVSLDVGVTLDIDPTGARPIAHVSILDHTSSTDFVDPEGSLFVLFFGIPSPSNCGVLKGNIEHGIGTQVDSRAEALKTDTDVQAQIEQAINTSSAVDLADLQHGPLSSLNIGLPGGGGFGLAGGHYVPTAPPTNTGGKILVDHEGVDVAASLAVTDLGGTRFPFSYQPGQSAMVKDLTRNRVRPGTCPPGAVSAIQCTGGGVVTAGNATISTTPPTTGPPLANTGVATRAASVSAVAAAPTAAPAATVAGAPTAAQVAGVATTATGTATSAPPTTAAAFGPRADVGGITTGTAVLTQGDTPPPTDFDIGLIVNGSTVNQISRALTAGSGDGTGVLDLDVDVQDQLAFLGPDKLHVRPSVPPLYLPQAPAGFPASGPVKFYLPSVQLSKGGLFTLSGDLSVGADAQIDTNTGHLVPLASSNLNLRVRVLRLHGINSIPDLGTIVVAGDINQLAQTISPDVLSVLKGVQIPDLAELTGVGMQLSHLTLATVGSGHLGIYFNVDPNPSKVDANANWVAATASAPTSVTVNAVPTGFPGQGDYSVHWTIRDAVGGAVLYQSPAVGESALSKTLDATHLNVTSSGNPPCFTVLDVGLKVDLQITRNNVTNSVTKELDAPGWPGPSVPKTCDPGNPGGTGTGGPGSGPGGGLGSGPPHL